MNKYLLDTNVLLRFLLGDHKEHSPLARELFRQAVKGKCMLILTDVAIAEAVWVLTSFYKIDRKETSDKLSIVITSAGVKCSQQDQMIDALNRFKNTACDFFDCLLAAMASNSNNRIATFDQDFKIFKDVILWDSKRSDF